MTQAVKDGYPKRLIEEAATRRQAAVDRGDEVIVGVNRYRLETEDEIAILEIDNKAVRQSQIARIEQTKRQRDPRRVGVTLVTLAEVASSGKGNILQSAVECARARATVGEISDVLRQAFGDHSTTPEVVGKIYGPAYEGESEFATLAERLKEVSEKLGQVPKVMVAKLGQDGHDRGAKVIASAFGDFGFDVLAGPLFQTPEEAAELAIAAGAHVVGLSSLAAGHKTLAPQLVEALRARDAGNVIVVVGGVVPRQDYQYLFDNSVTAIFGPGTNVLDAARAVLDLVEHRRRN